MLLLKIVFSFLNFIFLPTVCLSAGADSQNRAPDLSSDDLNESEASFYKEKSLREKQSEEKQAVRLELENDILHKLEFADGFPKVNHFKKKGSHASLILKDPKGMPLRELAEMEGFYCPIQVIFAIGAELLKRLELIHRIGILHRYINSESVYVFGNTVNLYDFRWAAYINEKQLVLGQVVATSGSLAQFQSVAALENRPQTAYDDLESVIYALIYSYYNGLPWSNFCDTNKDLLNWHKKARQNIDKNYFPKKKTEIISEHFILFAKAVILEKNTKKPFDYYKWIDLFQVEAYGNTIDGLLDRTIINGRYSIGKAWKTSPDFIICHGKDIRTDRDVMIKLEKYEKKFLEVEYKVYLRLGTDRTKIEGFVDVYSFTSYRSYSLFVQDAGQTLKERIGDGAVSLFVFEPVQQTLMNHFEGGEVSDEMFYRIAEQMMKLMEYIHLNRVIHRNITQFSFFVSKNVLYLMDFGMSIVLDNQTSHNDDEKKELFKRDPMFKSFYVLKGEAPTKMDDMIAVGFVLLFVKSKKKLEWLGTRLNSDDIINLQQNFINKLKQEETKNQDPLSVYLKYVTNDRNRKKDINYKDWIKHFSSSKNPTRA